jgi:hypothetical protein
MGGLICVNACAGAARDARCLEEGIAMSAWNNFFLIIVAVGFLGFTVAVGGLQLRLRPGAGARRNQKTAARETRKPEVIQHQQS